LFFVGTNRFQDEMNPSGQAHAVILRSTYAKDFPICDTAEGDENTFSNNLPGIKGAAGKYGTIGALAEAMNVLTNALAPLGLTNVNMPMTPNILWRAIQSAKPWRAS